MWPLCGNSGGTLGAVHQTEEQAVNGHPEAEPVTAVELIPVSSDRAVLADFQYCHFPPVAGEVDSGFGDGHFRFPFFFASISLRFFSMIIDLSVSTLSMKASVARMNVIWSAKDWLLI